MTMLPRHGSAVPAVAAGPAVAGAPKMRRTVGGYWIVEWTDASGQRRKRTFGKGRALARERYETWLVEWAATTQARRRKLDRPVTVAEAWDRYREHALIYYRRPDGSQTGEARRIGYAMKPVIALFGDEPAAAMTPAKLSRARQMMVEADNALGTVNQRIGAVRRVWRWLELEELVPAPVWQSLLALQRLKPGRTAARSRQPIMPAPDAAVEAACARLAPSLRAMVQLQLLTGMRPGEVCALTPAAVERNGVAQDLWVYMPRMHKTLHHGHSRRIRIGPRGRALLAPYLSGPQDAPAFSPQLARSERSQRPDETLAEVDGEGARWSVDSYRQAIARACEAARVMRWRPNQLRHNFATRVRAAAGLDAAQVALGHSSASITEIYALADDSKLAPVLEQHG